MAGMTSYNNGLQYTSVATAVADTETEARAFMVTDDTSGNNVEVQTSSMSSGVVLYCTKGVIYPIGGGSMQILSDSTTADTIVFLK